MLGLFGKSLSRSRKERAFWRIFFCTLRNEMLQASLCSSGWNIVLHRECRKKWVCFVVNFVIF